MQDDERADGTHGVGSTGGPGTASGLGRRRLLAAVAATGLAGCVGDGGRSPTATASQEAGDGDELDLREANVTGVAVEESGGEHRFDVTLIHDDEGEDGFANWWQVERLDGEQLGRRDLAHAHGTREFTRSDTFELPDVDCVVVRGHDQTHGYGGQAMLVTVATGATRAVRQGTDRQSFEGADCP